MIDTCIILAGGLASRFNGQIKPLIEVNGESLLARQINCAAQLGAKNITVVANPTWKSELSKAAKKISGDLNVRIVVQSEPTGTYPALFHAKHFIGARNLVFLSDIYIPDDIALSCKEATTCLNAENQVFTTKSYTSSEYTKNFAVIPKAGTLRADRFIEKPASIMGGHLGIGVFVLTASALTNLFRYHPESSKNSNLIEVMDRRLLRQENLTIVQTFQPQCNLNSPYDLTKFLFNCDSMPSLAEFAA